MKIQIKPLSVNDAWQGRRFKTPKYKKFESDLLFLLPKIDIPAPPYEFNYTFGFSSNGSDLLNPEKLVTDIICKKYGINDNKIHKMTLEKVIVAKGCEFITFEIRNLESF